MRSLLSHSAAVVALLSCSSLIADEKQTLFGRLDVNDDGFISQDEVEDKDARLYRRLLRTSDDDGDGKLSREEFVAGTTPQEPEPPAPQPSDRQPIQLGQFIERFDKNGDGKLDKDELPQQMRANFVRIDTNRDGVVGEAELARALQLNAAAQSNIRSLQRQAERAARDLFARHDKNEDGQLSLEEIPAESHANFKRALALLNKKSEDSLSLSQLVRGLTMLNQRGQPRASDRRPNQLPSNAQLSVRIGALFQALDANDDGKISADEMKAASESLGKLDKDGDGELTIRELLAQTRPAIVQVGGMSMEQMKERAKALDTDGDQLLSKEELPAALRGSFDRFDSNGDGKLDAREVQRLLPRLALIKRPQD